MISEITRSQQIDHRLASTRIRHGWSIEELAQNTHGAISGSRISNFEAGLRRPDIEVAETLASVFGDVSAAWLLTLDRDPGTDPALAEARLPAIGKP